MRPLIALLLSRLRLLSFILLLLSSTSFLRASVGGMTLSELIKGSDYIALAHVESVETINGIRIARAIPEQEFKGATGRKPFYFVAEGTWRCDTSHAVQSETVLLFLNRVKGNVVLRDMLSKPPARIGVKPLFSIALSGRGRMPLSNVQGKTYVTLYTDDVGLPRGIKTISGPEERYASFIRSVLLSDIVKLLPRPKATPALRSVPTFTMSR